MIRARLLALLAILASLTGCSLFTPPAHCVDRGDGLCWFANPIQIPVATYTWEVDTADNASRRCGYAQPFHHASCVMARNRERARCDVVSALPESVARRTRAASPLMRFRPDTCANSVLAHELQDHCGLNVCGGNHDGIQWLHAETVTRDIFGWPR